DDILPGASVLRLAQENIPKEPGTASYKTQVEAYALGAKNALSGFKTNLLDIGRSLAENPPADPGDIPNLPNNRKREIVAAKAKIDTAISVLPIVGVIEWAERSMPDNPVADTNDPTIYSQAVQSVIESFEQTLIGMGFERISTVGQRFDPRLHEAVNAEAISGEGAVIRSERQAGYRLGDFIIAPKVVVESQ
ncbi:MAG TPA: nucleotide exchange factor GrpE, partial [Candidatus Saccharimonadales bacterium]